MLGHFYSPHFFNFPIYLNARVSVVVVIGWSVPSPSPRFALPFVVHGMTLGALACLASALLSSLFTLKKNCLFVYL